MISLLSLWMISTGVFLGAPTPFQAAWDVLVLTRQHGLPFLHVLPTLIEDLLDIIGRSDDGIYYVVLHDVHETNSTPARVITPSPPVG